MVHRLKHRCTENQLLHFQSHTDNRYKDCLLKTMIRRAHTLSSTTDAFNEECDRLRAIFVRLQYPVAYINSAISSFVRDISSDVKDQRVKDSSVVRVSLPFKDQTSANAVKMLMRATNFCEQETGRRPQAKRSKATNHQSAVRGLFIFM